MKKIGILLILVALMTASSTAQAEIKEGSFSFAPFAGVYFFEGNQDQKTSDIYGVRAGYNFTKHLGLELLFSGTQTEIEDLGWHGTPWQDIYNYGIEGLYHFMPEGRFVPFIAIGFGGIHYSKGTHAFNDPAYYELFEANKIAVDYGAGLKYFLTDNFALRVDVRHELPLNGRWNNPNFIHNDLIASFGINLAFGGGKKVVEEAPKEEVKVEESHFPVPMDTTTDSDGDGVPDYLDKCPNTPHGVRVDKDGCPVDSDHDGVPDYRDKCPGTPRDVEVDKDGCPVDSDHDGVPDYRDKCPNTPSGVQVDKNGCPRANKVYMILKIEFDPYKADIKKKYHKEIKQVADFMKKNLQATANIAGHTDNIGNRKHNIKLSKARAESVRKYLIAKFGIKASRIKATGYGPDRPIASNKTPEGRQSNRRVVASFETVKTTQAPNKTYIGF